jgi:hypothetical protein
MITLEQAVNAARKEWESRGREWPQWFQVKELPEEFVVTIWDVDPEIRICVSVKDGTVIRVCSPPY